MTILITGGCGFIGSHLVKRLLRDGERIRVVDDLSTGKRDAVPSEVELVEADIADPSVFPPLLHDVDRVYHLAAIASVEQSRINWYRSHQVNIGGTVNLFHAIARSGAPIPVVYASSAAIYGNCTALPIPEQTAPSPASAYGADKLACELHGRIAAELHGIPNVGLRFFNVYGPGQDPHSPYSGVISIFMERAAKAQDLSIYGNGQQSRDFVFVEDVVHTMRTAMEKLVDGTVRQDVFNVGTGKAVTIRELAEQVRSLSGHDVAIRHAPARQGEILHSYCDNRHAGEVLGYLPSCPLEDGLKRTYEAFRL